MILADTSVWIDYLNGAPSRHANALDTSIVEGTVAMGDLIFLEILQGIRNDGEYARTRRALLTLDHFEMFGQAMAALCAENYRALRKQGITVRKTSDLIIASFCIKRRLPLLFTDRDFKPFVDHLGLVPAPI